MEELEPAQGVRLTSSLLSGVTTLSGAVSSPKLLEQKL